jgi:hypothetical protein
MLSHQYWNKEDWWQLLLPVLKRKWDLGTY